jgi:phosphohistidine phosphatase
MKIHLLRHAKTAKESKTGLDFDRELLQKGINQAEKMAEYLPNMENVDIHCSTSNRTRQTFDVVFLGKKISSIHFTQELYLSSAKETLNYVTNIKSKNDLFIIGHNNGLSDFASYISGEFYDFSTCEYVCFEGKFTNWSELSSSSVNEIATFRPEVGED